MNFHINLSYAQKVLLVLVQRNLIAFSCFCKNFATRLRLLLELPNKFLPLARLWPLEYRGKQYLSVVLTEIRRTVLNLKSMTAKKSVDLSLPINLGVSYPNIVVLISRSV